MRAIVVVDVRLEGRRKFICDAGVAEAWIANKFASTLRVARGGAGRNSRALFSMSRFTTYFAEVRPTLALAVPIIVGQVSQMLMGVTDSVMIGQTGTVPLAASSFGGNVFGVFYVVGIGLMLPVAVFVSRARGAGRPEECGEYLRHGLVLALGFGVLETVVMAVLGMQLRWFQQPPEVLAAVNPFFMLIGASITPVLVYLALRQFAEAMGRPWVPMFMMLGSVGLNVVLNWIFIWGHLGAPALGLAGAGLATLISDRKSVV